METAFVINLDSKQEEFARLQQQFLLYHIQCKRFPAVAHQRGSTGCTLSHLSLIRRAKEEQWPWILIIEDDCLVRHEMKEWPLIKNFLQQHKNEWDIFLGGLSMPHGMKLMTHFKTKAPLNLVECKRGFLMHFSIINSSSYDKLLSWHELPQPQEERPIIDIYAQEFDFRIWTTSPFIAWQKPHDGIDYTTTFVNDSYQLYRFCEKVKKSFKYRFFRSWIKGIK